MKTIECIDCGQDFNPNEFRHKRKGKFNQCEDCTSEFRDERKSLGIMVTEGKTDYHVEIIEHPTDSQRKLVKKQQSAGPTQCHSYIGLNTNGANTPKDNIDKVQESLEKESKKEKKGQQFKR